MPASLPALPHEVTVAGVPVRYGVTGSGAVDLVLLHGSMAHHGWWHAVTPLLTDRWRVISMDLSGHGDSGHRAEYDGATWAEEVTAVIRAAGARRPVVAAHSLGGRVAILAAGTHPEKISALVLFDCGVVTPPALRGGLTLPPARPPRVYPTAEAARAAFKLAPAQPEPPAEVLDTVVDHGLRPVEGGWIWKHGGQRFPTLYGDDLLRCAGSLTMPVTYVYGGQSAVVDDEAVAGVARTLPGARMIRLPELHHHLVLEAPQTCARLIDEAAAPA